MPIDVSLVLNLHREGKYIFRTLSSLQEAISYASAHGIVVELVVTLDRPNELTRQAIRAYDLTRFDHIEIIEVDRGSLGLARNDGIEKARGKYVRLCDGDDLVSFNLIQVMYFLAEALGPKAILIAEWLFGFGESYFRHQYQDLDIVTPLSLISEHPFVSQIFLHRSLGRILRFEDVRLTCGYAYEDWHFAANAIALGYKYFIAKHTIMFYRQRQNSLIRQVNSISVQQIPPAALFVPEKYIEICTDSYQTITEAEPDVLAKDDRVFIDGSICSYLMHAANQIEPAIAPEFLRSGDYRLSQRRVAIGRRYYEVCGGLLSQKFTDIFIVPFFGRGGAEKYLANIIFALLELVKGASVLLILGERHPDNTWLSEFPKQVKFVELSQWLEEIGPQGIDIITLKLIQSFGSQPRLHIRASEFGLRFLATYGRALGSNKRIFYCFSQAANMDGDMRFTERWRFEFVSENLENIDLVVTDSLTLLRFDRQRIGITPEKWRVIPPACELSLDRSTALARRQRTSNRILWASRISKEKRPELIVAAARELSEREMDLTLEVHGEFAKPFEPSFLEKHGRIEYRGAYTRFSDCANGDFICLMYTSSQDGLPNVLLEAAAAGVPIVAPNVGGISEFVEAGVTGLLLPDIPDVEAMAEAYVDAFLRLRDDAALRARLAAAAYDRVASRHDIRALRANLMTALEISLG